MCSSLGNRENVRFYDDFARFPADFARFSNVFVFFFSIKKMKFVFPLFNSLLIRPKSRKIHVNRRFSRKLKNFSLFPEFFVFLSFSLLVSLQMLIFSDSNTQTRRISYFLIPALKSVFSPMWNNRNSEKLVHIFVVLCFDSLNVWLVADVTEMRWLDTKMQKFSVEKKTRVCLGVCTARRHFLSLVCSVLGWMSIWMGSRVDDDGFAEQPNFLSE